MQLSMKEIAVTAARIAAINLNGWSEAELSAHELKVEELPDGKVRAWYERRDAALTAVA